MMNDAVNEAPQTHDAMSPDTIHPSDEHWYSRLDDIAEALLKEDMLEPMLSEISNSTSNNGAVQIAKRYFEKYSPHIMEALDIVADAHPVVKIVVIAFRAVFNLVKRLHENLDKITILFGAMNDMMVSILRLKYVRDQPLTINSGHAAVNRIKALSKTAADDVYRCFQDCDTYLRLTSFERVFRSSAWESKLAEYVDTFQEHRAMFQTLLLEVITIEVIRISDKIDRLTDKVTEGFEKLTSPEHVQLLNKIKAHGGPESYQHDDGALRDLIEGWIQDSPTKADYRASFEDLKKGLFEDLKATVERNADHVEAKLTLQRKQLERIDEQTALMVATFRGLGGKIFDPDIQTIWDTMQWRGNSVKASDFVLALRDHFSDKFFSQGTLAADMRGHPDAWAVNHFNVKRLQPIMEAFDDDASGSITILEINRFTSSPTRPQTWRLPHWIAFWAVGWKMSSRHYKDKIVTIIEDMTRILPSILPVNRQSVNVYQQSLWEMVYPLIAAPGLNDSDTFDGCNPDVFKQFTDSEEQRLQASLAALQYVIDGPEMLPLVTGPARIENTLFPLLYLVIARHHQIIKLATTQVISDEELARGTRNITGIMSAVRLRVDVLCNSWQLQQAINPRERFKYFACGIFQCINDSAKIPEMRFVKDISSTRSLLPGSQAKENRSVASDELALAQQLYGNTTISSGSWTPQAGSDLDDICGIWHCLAYDKRGMAFDINGSSRVGITSMITIQLRPGTSPGEIKGSGWTNPGLFPVHASAKRDVEKNYIAVTFELSFPSPWKTSFFTGQFIPDTQTISGLWGYSPELSISSPSLGGYAVYKRMAPEFFRFYPSLHDLVTHRARARWIFAIRAVLDAVRRESWTWSYFRGRRDNRQRYISLYIDWETFQKRGDFDELGKCAREFVSTDACFYTFRARYIRDTMFVHLNHKCDCCGGRITEACTICLDCKTKESEPFNYVALCQSKACINSCVTMTQRPDLVGSHEPNHRVVKIRAFIPKPVLPLLLARAKHVWEKIETVCMNVEQEQDRSCLEVSNGQLSRPPCRFCRRPFTLPFWYCVDCHDDLFICPSCDSNINLTHVYADKKFNKPYLPVCKEEASRYARLFGIQHHHSSTHTVIRCQTPPRVKSSEDLIVLLYDRITTLETGIRHQTVLRTAADKFAEDYITALQKRAINLERLFQLIGCLLFSLILLSVLYYVG